MTGKETCRTYREVSDKSRYEFWVTNEYVVQSGWDERTALRVVDGRWDELKDEYGDEMVRLLMEAHGYTAKEAEESLAGGEGDGEGGAVVVVVEHGEQRVMPEVQSHPQLLVQQGRQRRGHGRGLDVGGARVRKQRETTSRYGAGAFTEMEAALRGHGTDDGVT